MRLETGGSGERSAWNPVAGFPRLQAREEVKRLCVFQGVEEARLKGRAFVSVGSGPIVGLYDRYLAIRHQRHEAAAPEHVAIVLTERDLLEQSAYTTLERVLGWAMECGAERVTVMVSVLDEAVVPTLKRQLEDIDGPQPLAVRGPEATDQPDAPIRVSIGLGGKREFADAVQGLAASVEAGQLSPAEIDESEVTDRLVFPEEPDLVIKTGAERLSDFMIWQSVYSELYFTDINWRDFRKRDYLRAVIDFQTRQRRFGR